MHILVLLSRETPCTPSYRFIMAKQTSQILNTHFKPFYTYPYLKNIEIPMQKALYNSSHFWSKISGGAFQYLLW